MAGTGQAIYWLIQALLALKADYFEVLRQKNMSEEQIKEEWKAELAKWGLKDPIKDLLEAPK